MKTLFKVKIYNDKKFIGYGEFVKEGCYFSLVSNIPIFDGHKNRYLKNYKYIWAFTGMGNIDGMSFDEIAKYLKTVSPRSFYDFEKNEYFFPEFVLSNSNNFDRFDEIKL
jgi:hypothetical protein